jgi:hypothetical protein
MSALPSIADIQNGVGANKKTSKLKTLTQQWAVRANASGYGLGCGPRLPLAR